MSTGIKKKPARKKKTQSSPSNLTEIGKRDTRLVKIILKNPEKPLNEAMIEAGFSETTANKQAKRTVEKSSIQTAMQKALDKAGINDDSLANNLKDGLAATKVISAVAGNQANGGTVDFVDVPDFPSRRQFQDMAHKLRSDYPDPKVDVEHTGSVDLVVNVIDYSKVDVEGDK